MDKIKFSAFQNICRVCMCSSDLIFIQANNIINILEFLSGFRYSKTDELPQRLCVKCIGTINKIHTFSVQCKQTHYSLTKCLNDLKNNEYKEQIKQEADDINNQQIMNKHVLKDGLFQQIVMMRNEVINNKEQTMINCHNKTTNIDNIIKRVNKIEFIEIKQEILDQDLELNIQQIVAKDKILNENDENNVEFLTEHKVKNELEQMTMKEEIKIEELIISDINEINDTNSVENNSNLYHDKPEMTYMKNNSKRYSGKVLPKCDVCNKTFKNLHYLFRHKRMHSDERPYVCDFCSKSFKRQENLKVHKLVHNGERPFQCDVCSKSFKRPQILKEHKRIHSGERPYHCEVCNKGFSQKAHLVTHKATHTNERRFECNMCMKSYTQSNNLIEHKRKHTGERPYRCSACEQTFIRSTDLKRHKKVHSDE